MMKCTHFFLSLRTSGSWRCFCCTIILSIIFIFYLEISTTTPDVIQNEVVHSSGGKNGPTSSGQTKPGSYFPLQFQVNGIFHSVIREDESSFPLNFEKRLSYPINLPDVCSSNHISILMSVHSAVTNFKRRQVMRKGPQGKYVRRKKNNATLVFFLGIPSNSTFEALETQRQVERESRQYGDIVQMNTADTYHNVVQKAVGALQWITKYCANSEFVMKMDDDIAVNVSQNLAALVKMKKTHPDFIMGEKRINRSPHRDTKSKNFVNVDAYPYSTWPPFVPGGLMGYPTTTALQLYQQAIKTRPVWVDDVFISGICAQKLGIPIVDHKEFRYSHLTI